MTITEFNGDLWAIEYLWKCNQQCKYVKSKCTYCSKRHTKLLQSTNLIISSYFKSLCTPHLNAIVITVLIRWSTFSSRDRFQPIKMRSADQLSSADSIHPTRIQKSDRTNALDSNLPQDATGHHRTPQDVAKCLAAVVLSRLLQWTATIQPDVVL